MHITPSAHAKLHDLLRRSRAASVGFHFGKLGGCHGAVPRLRPGATPRPGERRYDFAGLPLFMRPREFAELEPYTLDYAKGLFVSRFVLEADCHACVAAHLC